MPEGCVSVTVPGLETCPDKTIPLRLLANASGRCEANRSRRKVDLSEMPRDQIGVYVLRFTERTFPRLVGESPILKIGSTARTSFYHRFRSYNGKCEATVYEGGLASLTRDYCTNAKTEFQFMWMLPRVLELGPAVFDLY